MRVRPPAPGFAVDADRLHEAAREPPPGRVVAREADYPGAVLNSPVVNEKIKPFQSRGLLGERDIPKKVLELQVTATLPKSLGQRRARVREVLRGRLEKIDEIVRRIL